jgi:hypothetical protein
MGRRFTSARSDDGVDLRRRQLGAVERIARRPVEQPHGILEIEGVAFGPAMRRFVPVDGHGGIAPLDAGMAEDRHQPVEIDGGVLGEEMARARRHIGLAQRIRRHRSGEREKAGCSGVHWRRAPDAARVHGRDNGSIARTSSRSLHCRRIHASGVHKRAS